MSSLNDPIKFLLLDLLSPSKKISSDALVKLNPDACVFFLKSVREHRLGPMLRYMLDRHHLNVIIPDPIRNVMDQAYKVAVLRSLSAKQSLIKIHRQLVIHRVPYIALKGAYLAFHAYPEAALRPMRDLDILVPKDRDLEAYFSLLAEGNQRIEQFSGDPVEVSKTSHHLPQLLEPNGRMIIEIHNALSHAQDAALSLAQDSSFWSRATSQPIGNELVMFESPIDLMLHLIHHSVYHHHFDNGPLLLSDIAFLLKRCEIDWMLFWVMANHQGINSGCILALKLVERYWPETVIVWPKQAYDYPSEELLDDAACSLLRDYELRIEVTLKSNLSKADFYSKLGLLISKAFPSKNSLCKIYPTQPDSFGIYYYYMVNIWRIMTQRFPMLFQSRMIDHSGEIAKLQRVDTWLKAHSGSECV